MSVAVPRDEHEYIYAVARVRVLETHLLDRATLQRMVDAESAQAAFNILMETEYAESASEAGDVYDFEKGLTAHLKWVYDYLASFMPDSFVLDLLRLRFDFHNLKVVLKAKLLNFEPNPGALYDWGTTPVDVMSSVVSAAIEGATEIRSKTLPEGLLECIKEVLREPSVREDPQLIDLIADKCYHQTRVALARASGREVLQDWVKAAVDIANMKISLRGSKLGMDKNKLQLALIPGGKVSIESLKAVAGEGIEEWLEFWARSPYSEALSKFVKTEKGSIAFTELEKWADSYLAGLIQRGRHLAFGPEPIVAYAVAKETEIKNLRIILTGKLNGLPGDMIRERLRDVYA
ncbi:MAG TPA: hypothetical protein GXX40_04200 [Firmicutes bacterium]|nr:hypothetical protein [Bacillota bacterium]